MIVVIGLYALFALAFVINKATLAFVSPLWLVGLRLLIGGLGACGVVRVLGYKFSIARRDWRVFSVIVLFNVLATNVLEIFALGGVPAARAALIYTLSPFFGALIAWIWYRTTLHWQQWLGLCIGFCGVLCGALVHWSDCCAGLTVSDGLLAAAACSTVIGWSAVQQLIFKRGYHPLVVNGVSFVIGGAGVLGISCLRCLGPGFTGTLGLIKSVIRGFFNPFVPAETVLSSPNPFVPSAHRSLGEGGCIEGSLLYGLIGIVLAAVLSTTAYVCYAYLLRRYSVVFMTFASFSSPLLTALFGLVFLSEPITCAFVIALACVACGLIIFYRAE